MATADGERTSLALPQTGLKSQENVPKAQETEVHGTPQLNIFVEFLTQKSTVLFCLKSA